MAQQVVEHVKKYGDEDFLLNRSSEISGVGQFSRSSEFVSRWEDSLISSILAPRNSDASHDYTTRTMASR